MGTFTERLTNYPFEKIERFIHDGKHVSHYFSKRVMAQEINGVMTILRVDINDNGNWWYLNEYQSFIFLDNPNCSLDFILSLLKFEYSHK